MYKNAISNQNQKYIVDKSKFGILDKNQFKLVNDVVTNKDAKYEILYLNFLQQRNTMLIL